LTLRDLNVEFKNILIKKLKKKSSSHPEPENPILQNHHHLPRAPSTYRHHGQRNQCSSSSSSIFFFNLQRKTQSQKNPNEDWPKSDQQSQSSSSCNFILAFIIKPRFTCKSKNLERRKSQRCRNFSIAEETSLDSPT
ncbi:hypothetical protein VIGAN_03294900, partial [Vigna angularis var. angularis]